MLPTNITQQVKTSRSSDMLHPMGAAAQPHPQHGGSSSLLLRHASSDPMLLDNNDKQAKQWNNSITTKHRSSSYDNMLQQKPDNDSKPTTPDSDPQHASFYIEHSDDDLDDFTREFTKSLPVTRNDKHRTLSQPPSILHRLSPKSSPKHSPELKRKQVPPHHRSCHGLPKSSKLVDKSRAEANNPVLSRKKPRSVTMLETSAADLEKSRAQLGRYFKPGILMLKDVNPRMCIIQKKLKERESDFCFTKEMK